MFQFLAAMPMADALVRELKEEVGVGVEVDSLVCVTNPIVSAENVHWVSPVYLVRVVSEDVRNLEPEKSAAVEWFF